MLASMLYTLTWHVLEACHGHGEKCWVFSLFVFSLQQNRREQLSVTYPKGVVAPLLFLSN
jgi:hypothetical protein